MASVTAAKLTGTRADQVNQIMNLIASRIGGGPGGIGVQEANSFGAYAQTHPTVPAKQAYLAWFMLGGDNPKNSLGSNLAKDIGTSVGGAGQLSGASLKSIGPTFGALDVWKGLSLGTLALRAAEILLGIVLIGVGLAKLTGAENAVSKVAKNGLPLAMG